jgi:hypothetical protein
MNAVIRTVGEPKLLLLPLPLQASRIHSPGHPEGGRHGCRPFSDQAMDGLSENGDGTTHALSDFEVTRKVLSFGYFSLHQQRKVTRRKAKALCSSCQSRVRCRTKGKIKVEGVSPSRASYFLLLAQKKVTKENGLLVTSKSLKPFAVPGEFSDSASCLGPKTPAIHGRRPPGLRLDSRLVVYPRSTSGAEGAA